MSNQKYTIPEHWDTGATLTPQAEPAAEYALWYGESLRPSNSWNGTEFTLEDFETYIAQL